MPRKSEKHQGLGNYHQEIKIKSRNKLEKYLDTIESKNCSLEYEDLGHYKHWPSMAEISRETGLNYRTIKKIIENIEKYWDGYIKFKIVIRSTHRMIGKRLNQRIGVVYYPKSFTSFLSDHFAGEQLFYEGDAKTLTESYNHDVYLDL